MRPPVQTQPCCGHCTGAPAASGGGFFPTALVPGRPEEIAADDEGEIGDEEEDDDVIDLGSDAGDGDELLDAPEDEAEADGEAEAELEEGAREGELKEGVGEADGDEGDGGFDAPGDAGLEPVEGVEGEDGDGGGEGEEHGEAAEEAEGGGEGGEMEAGPGGGGGGGVIVEGGGRGRVRLVAGRLLHDGRQIGEIPDGGKKKVLGAGLEPVCRTLPEDSGRMSLSAKFRLQVSLPAPIFEATPYACGLFPPHVETPLASPSPEDALLA